MRKNNKKTRDNKKILIYVVLILSLLVVTFFCIKASSNSLNFALLFTGYTMIVAFLIGIPIRYKKNKHLLRAGITLIVSGIVSYSLTEYFSSSLALDRNQLDTLKQYFMVLAAAVGANFVAQAVVDQRDKGEK